MKDSLWHIYLVRCDNNALYTGIAKDVDARFTKHCEGKGAKFLRGKKSLTLVFQAPVGSYSEALKAEYRIKKQNKPLKERLVNGDISLDDLLNSVD